MECYVLETIHPDRIRTKNLLVPVQPLFHSASYIMYKRSLVKCERCPCSVYIGCVGDTSLPDNNTHVYMMWRVLQTFSTVDEWDDILLITVKQIEDGDNVKKIRMGKKLQWCFDYYDWAKVG